MELLWDTKISMITTRLRNDPFLGMLCDKRDPSGLTRSMDRDKGKATAGKSTLNRLELGAVTKNRYKKITPNMEAIDHLLIDIFLESYTSPPKELVLDLDVTDDRIHGQQEGRFFHGYYKGYCYLPLYIFCEDQLLCARLRTADRDASDGSLVELERIVQRIREAWPTVRIIIRADAGFAREKIMAWCETNRVEYVLGLAKNQRLKAELTTEMREAKQLYEKSGQASRIFKDFRYQTLKSWSSERRVVGKSRVFKSGRESSIYRHITWVKDSSRKTLRRHLLCSWRHGKPNQRTATLSFCRSNFDSLDAFKPTASVLYLFCLCHHRDTSTACSFLDRAFWSAVPYNS